MTKERNPKNLKSRTGTTPSLLPEPPKPFRAFSETHPEIARAYESLGEAVRKAGPLSEREIALVKLALSIGMRQEGGTHAHARKALAAGLEPDALRQVAILAVPTLGFPTMMAALSWVEETIQKKGKPRRP